jgi:hypothetical protein
MRRTVSILLVIFTVLGGMQSLLAAVPDLVSTCCRTQAKVEGHCHGAGAAHHGHSAAGAVANTIAVAISASHVNGCGSSCCCDLASRGSLAASAGATPFKSLASSAAHPRFDSQIFYSLTRSSFRDRGPPSLFV